LENDFNHFRYIGDQNKCFCGDFEGNLRSKHAFKDLSQRWRCNWGARCPITEIQRFNKHRLAPGAQHFDNVLLFCVTPLNATSNI